MSTSPLPSARADLHNFFQYGERLLASVQATDHAPFTHDELKRICFLSNEIAKLADSQLLGDASNGKPDGYRLDSARLRDSRSA
jgi:hypothetical protein